MLLQDNYIIAISLTVLLVSSLSGNGIALEESSKGAFQPQETITKEKKSAFQPEETITEEKKSAFQPEETIAEEKKSAFQPEGISTKEKKSAFQPEETIIKEENTVIHADIGGVNSAEPPVAPRLSAPGEPTVTYYTPVGYAPTTSGPLTIKKVARPVETGKGSANRIRVDVEITSAKKNREDDMINDIDIYEYVDESLNIVPPADDIDEVDRSIESSKEFQGLSREEKYSHFSEMPLINFKKMSAIESIGFLKLALMRESPMCSANADIYKKIYATPESEEMVKYEPPFIINNNIFYFDKFNESNLNETDGTENLNNLSKYLDDSYGIDWIKPYNINSNYNKIKNKIDLINITKRIEESDSDDWIQIKIDDINRTEGLALLNLSGRATYYLRFDNTSEIDSDHWQIQDWNAIMHIHIRSISSKDRLFCWYYVRPKKSGDFNTESIIRINDNDYKGWPDMIYPLNIVVGSPDFRFEVEPILEDSRVYFNPEVWYWKLFWKLFPDSYTRLPIKYLITYIGDSSKTYLGNVNLTIKPPDGCQFYSDLENPVPLGDHGLTFYEKNFSNSKTVSLKRYISYNDTGMYRVPELWIEGTPYTSKETFVVENPVIRGFEILQSYYTIITALLILLVNKELKGILRPILRLFHRPRKIISKFLKKQCFYAYNHVRKIYLDIYNFFIITLWMKLKKR